MQGIWGWSEIRTVSAIYGKFYRQGIKQPTLIPQSEPNVNQILEDTRTLAQIWDLYGHLLNEDKT
ncbi:MAG: hypothetical protein C0448_14410 [Sphingobacteriaceae bacterium]|nr:hypothetical protein [Sphingobacteriaceae bacterium]